MNGPTAEGELNRLRRIAARYRATLVQQYSDGDITLADLSEALSDAGLDPYGSGQHVVVTISFKIGLEDDDTPPRSVDIEQFVEAIRETADDDVEWAILHPEDGFDVNISPILRGHLPS